MTEDDLPPDTGDHRPVRQRALREAMHMTGKEMGAALKARDTRIKKLESAVGLLAEAVDRIHAKR